MKRGLIRAPWSLAMREVLSDGQWHDRRELVAVGVVHVPPGMAHREHRRHLPHGEVRRGYVDSHSAVLLGATRVATAALRSWVASGTVERRGELIRMKVASHHTDVHRSSGGDAENAGNLH